MINRKDLSWGTRRELEACEARLERVLKNAAKVSLPALQDKLLNDAIRVEERINVILGRR